VTLALVLLVACGGTQRVIADDPRCTEDKLTSFALRLGVADPTFDVEAPAGAKTGRRYAEFPVTGSAKDKVREIAEASAMEIELNGLDNGILVRATCK
jgi:hypothetical protein